MTDKQVYLLAAAIMLSGQNPIVVLIGGVFLFAAFTPDKKPSQEQSRTPNDQSTITLKYRL